MNSLNYRRRVRRLPIIYRRRLHRKMRNIHKFLMYIAHFSGVAVQYVMTGSELKIVRIKSVMLFLFAETLFFIWPVKINSFFTPASYPIV